MKMKNIAIAVCSLALIAVVGLSSLYTVKSGQEVVIQRFGGYYTTVNTPGINFKVPFVDKATIVDVNQIHRLEFGLSTVGTESYEDDLSASLMLTSDENIAMVETIVQYQIENSKDYLFQVDDVEGTLKVIAESAIRRGIASYTLDDALTENKSQIQGAILDDLQSICDKYKSGIRIVAVQLQDVNPPAEVDAAFKDVAGAREDKNSYINEANTYVSEVIPKARGEAATMISGAKAYKTKRSEEAKGDVAAYNQLYERYLEGEGTTRTRLYLEMMQEVLPDMQIFIMDDSSSMKLFDMGT